MKSKFTQEDLVRYIYRETGPEETRAIQYAIASDAGLRNLYLEYLHVKRSMDGLHTEVPEATSTELHRLLEGLGIQYNQ